ncbi:MAG: hypothetical protein AAF291_12880 [Pseudomonadota bacterium]
MVDGFDVAREKLRQLTTIGRELPGLDQIMSQQTIDEMTGKRLIKGAIKPSVDFSQQKQKALIWYLSGQPRHSLYDQIRGNARFLAKEAPALLEGYEGTFWSFRFFQRKPNVPIELTWGKVVISNDDVSDNPVFEHWSEDYLKKEGEKARAENIGLVFKANSLLFFPGVRDNVLRLAVAKTYQKGGKREGFLSGALVSVRNDGSDPFGARFIMVHEDNDALTKKLKGPTGSDVLKQLIRVEDEHWAQFFSA